jgi:hypothetical protein
MRLLRALAVFLGIVAVIAAICVLAGVLFAAIRGGTSYSHAIAWAMWIGGALVALATAQSGSTTRMAGESRVVLGGRFTLGSDIPQPRSPWFLVPAGVVVILLGVLVYTL